MKDMSSRILRPVFLALILISIQGLCSIASGQFALNVETAYLPGSTKPARVLVDFESQTQFSSYGGWLEQREESTGFFYTTKVGGTWYIVDPDGYLFYSSGINSVVKGGGFKLPDSLQYISCNTMGCWSDESINTGVPNKIAYTPRWNMMLSYKNTSQRTQDLYDKGIIPVFDSQFGTFCLQLSYNEIAPLKNDPYILGHFSDNELPIYDNSTYGYLLDRFLNISSKTDPNFLAADSWMKSRHGSNYTITEADRDEFHGYVMGTYYKIVSTAIKTYDGNHMYLGSRLHGAAKSKPSIFREAGKYVDIISINVYSVWTPSMDDMDMWSGLSGRPFLVTEYYAKAEDSGLDNSSGAGWLVNAQSDRAKFFENFTLALIAHPGSVGYHHFKYIDKETYNTGLVSMSFEWYKPLKNSFNKIGKDIYNLREFMIKGYVGEGIATVYTADSYQDKARLLNEGSYTASSLAALGLTDNSLASLKVKPGFKVILYSDDLFTGSSVEMVGDVPDLDQFAFGLKTTSLKVVASSTGINDQNHESINVALFPNPASNILNIELPETGVPVKLTIFSLIGQPLMIVNDLKGNFSVDISSIEPGTYFVLLSIGNMKVTRKIIITD